MKNIALVLICFCFVSMANAQTTTENIKRAFNAGSAKELVKYFNRSTEVKINDEGDNYSIVQAEPILKEFFKLNPPTTFDYIHKGQSPEGLKYNIGSYKSTKKNYRIVVLLKIIDGDYVVDTINFNEE